MRTRKRTKCLQTWTRHSMFIYKSSTRGKCVGGRSKGGCISPPHPPWRFSCNFGFILWCWNLYEQDFWHRHGDRISTCRFRDISTFSHNLKNENCKITKFCIPLEMLPWFRIIQDGRFEMTEIVTWSNVTTNTKCFMLHTKFRASSSL